MQTLRMTVLAAAAACGLAALAPGSAEAYWVAPVVVAPPPVVYVRPVQPVYVPPPRVAYAPYYRAHWVRPHYDRRGVFIPGHWA